MIKSASFRWGIFWFNTSCFIALRANFYCILLMKLKPPSQRLSMKYRILNALSLASAVLAIAACSGGGSSSTSTTAATSTGQVIDSPVSGLAYKCGSSSGYTDVTGSYTYTKGDSCTFSVGNVTVGTLSAVPQDGIITPQDMAVVLRASTDDLNALAVAQFLQSINSGTVPGVITISSAATSALSSVSAQSILTDGLCFGSSSATNCQMKLAALVSTATAGKNALVSVATAKAALEAGMLSAKVSNLKGLVQTTNAAIQICDASNTTNNSQFALCAASTCTATGGQISVATSSGGTASFPEMKCTCPVVTGTSIADVKGGNMQGSCATPAASAKYPNPIWSLFSLTQSFPQQSATPAYTSNAASSQICPGTGTQMVTNCWSFECTVDPVQTNGVTTATCYCPLGENLSGGAVAAGTPFYTEAGGAAVTAAGKADACNYNPVGAPFALPATH
jgi:hypothetical protein